MLACSGGGDAVGTGGSTGTTSVTTPTTSETNPTAGGEVETLAATKYSVFVSDMPAALAPGLAMIIVSCST